MTLSIQWQSLTRWGGQLFWPLNEFWVLSRATFLSLPHSLPPIPTLPRTCQSDLQLTPAPTWHGRNRPGQVPASAMDAASRFWVVIGASMWVYSWCCWVSTGWKQSCLPNTVKITLPIQHHTAAGAGPTGCLWARSQYFAAARPQTRDNQLVGQIQATCLILPTLVLTHSSEESSALTLRTQKCLFLEIYHFYAQFWDVRSGLAYNSGSSSMTLTFTKPQKTRVLLLEKTHWKRWLNLLKTTCS